MPFVRCHVGGTRAPHPEGGTYEWEHAGQVLDVDHETAAGIVGMPLFTEVHDHDASEVRHDPPPDKAGETEDDADSGDDDSDPGSGQHRRRKRRTASVRE